MTQIYGIGWIPYLNLLPLGEELKKLDQGQIKFRSGHPTDVNRWLREGTVNLAPSSSVNLVISDQLSMPMAVGVASTGPVMSVYLGGNEQAEEVFSYLQSHAQKIRQLLPKEPANVQQISELSGSISSGAATHHNSQLKVPSVKLTPRSEASAALVRLMWKLSFDQDVSTSALVTDADAPAIELVIGDEALIRRKEFAHILDLGAWWQGLTGLPFVFAVWQANGVVPEELLGMIARASKQAEQKMQTLPGEYLAAARDKGVPEDLLVQYWDSIEYQLRKPHFKGLELYLDLIKRFRIAGKQTPAVQPTSAQSSEAGT